MIDDALAGARLIGRRYGLVADLDHRNDFKSHFYMILEFRKGSETTLDIYPCDIPDLAITLVNLGKIVKHKEIFPGKVIYTYTDGSWDSFGN